MSGDDLTLVRTRLHHRQRQDAATELIHLMWNTACQYAKRNGSAKNHKAAWV